MIDGRKLLAGIVVGTVSLFLTGNVEARLHDKIDKYEDKLTKLSRKYAIPRDQIIKFRDNFAVHFLIIDTKIVKNKDLEVDYSKSVMTMISQMKNRYESLEMILSLHKCSMKYGVRQMARFAKKYWSKGKLDDFTIIALYDPYPNKFEKNRPAVQLPIKGLWKGYHASFWSVGNIPGRAFFLETDPYFRVREMMKNAFYHFLEEKSELRQNGQIIPGGLPKAKDADGIGCLDKSLEMILSFQD